MTPNDEAATCACRICGSRDTADLVVREMMFGTRMPFTYLECRACGCVQIDRYPENIGDHYPPDYYSFRQGEEGSAPSWFDAALKRVKMHALSRLAPYRNRFRQAASTAAWLERRPLAALYFHHVPDPAARILDVGCGAGSLLKDLRTLHYERAEGIDPFVAVDIRHEGRILVRRRRLDEVDGPYDCVSLHHVLEHMPDQHGTLRHIRRILSRKGLAMIRIPIVGGIAWREYREDWPQMDPPRHFYLHSEGSFRLLARQCGFAIESMEYDSVGFQFWGAELIRRGIALTDPRSPFSPGGSAFSEAELAQFERRAQDANRKREGDQVVLILRPA